uniref:Membrane protein of ER body-like protein n=1 Tax=Noccaea caerulescens TaxID=107243 RepID=A0A1J3FAH5_NOCCA
MGSAAELTDPTTTGTERKHQPLQVEEQEEDEQVVELDRKTPSFRHAKRPNSPDSSTNTSSSSSFSGDVIPDIRNGEGDHVEIENLEVLESPEHVTEIGFHEEHDGENNCNVYFDGEQGSEPADAEPDVDESQTADHLNGEKKQPESEKDSTSEDNKESREIEEVQDGDLPKELDAVEQRTNDVIEEEIDIDDVEDYEVEKVLAKQETHDLFCPNCNSCITKRVVLKKRKRKIPHVLDDPKRLRVPHESEPLIRSEDNLPFAVGGESSVHESFIFKCLSCFSIFIPAGVGSKPLPPSEAVEGLKTQPKPTGDSNCFGSLFEFKKKKPAVQQGGAMSSVPEVNPPRDNLNVTAKIPSEAPVLVQDGAATPVQVANSNDKGKVVNDGATVEQGQKVLTPLAEEETLQKIDKADDASAADEKLSSGKGRLTPMQPSPDMNVSNTVTSGPDGVRVETIFHSEGVSHPFEGTDTRKPDFGQAKVTDLIDTGNRGVITDPASSRLDIAPLPVSSLEEGTLTEPLLTPVVEGRKVEILKSIVYGGLIEAITSLGVISSAAGSGASTLNILVLGLANLFGGLILIIHNLQELRDEDPRITTTTTEDNQSNRQEQGRYKRLLGRKENFTLHATVVILSFIIAGLLPPIVYYFSFSKTHNINHKVASVFGASLLFIVLLALAKAHVKTPRGSLLKSVLYYTMIAVSVSGISFVVGDFVDHLLEKYGWSDGSETPAGHMMLSLMGRKAGSFGYASSY